MLRFAILVVAASLAGAVQAQTSNEVNSSSPGSPPLTGPSLSPGETTPSQPMPFNSGTGAGSSALDNTPLPSLGVPSQPVPFSAPSGAVLDNAIQMEMARCNSMAGGARELCVNDLRSRVNSGSGSRSAPGGLSNPGSPATSGSGSGAGSPTNPGAPSRPAN